MPRRIRNSIKKKKKPRLAFPCRTKPEEHCPRKPYSKCGTRSSRVFRQDMHRYTWKSFPRSNKTEKRNPTPICTLRDLERFHKGKTEVGHSRRFHTYIMLHLQCLPRIKKKAKKLMRLCLGQASRVPSNDTYIPHAHTRAVTKTCA